MAVISFQIFPIVGVGARTIAMRLGVNAAARITAWISTAEDGCIPL